MADRTFGPGATLIIAELSGNHGHSLDRAVALVRAAVAAGADAVKLQTYTPETITLDLDSDAFQVRSGTVWDGQTLHQLYAEAYTPWEWHARLADEARELGVILFSSPFDPTAVEFLEHHNVPAYKVASAEIIDIGLIQLVARTGKPIILSTGMATLPEIEEAVAVAREAGATELALLKCTSAYPAPPGEMNLRTIPDLESRFGAAVGLSDHSLGIAIPVAAVSIGAVIIEKHLTMSRADGGPDSGFSLEPAEFAGMVEAIRIVEQALGEVSFEPTASEAPSRILRRSLFVVEDMAAGEVFNAANVRSIRPGQGLHTRHLPEVLGKYAVRPIARGTPLAWDMIRPDPL
jgi:N-acetylneuraminate synthase